MLRVTPVYGSRFDEEGAAQAPTCTLVEYGGVRVLWNVGWWGEADETATLNAMTTTISNANTNTNTSSNPFAAQAPQTSFPPLPDHDVLILSDSTLNSLGGLPLYYETHWKPHQQLQQQLLQQQQQQSEHPSSSTATPSSSNNANTIPMYATFPTVKMGQMTLYDHHASISLDGGRPPYTLEQMDDAFSHLQTIKYSQTILLPTPKKPSLSITAHRAGHVVGGAFFVLKRLQDETIVVLTPPTYNIAKELHLDSSDLLKYGATPDVLVTYPGGPAMKYICKLYDSNTSGASSGSGSGSASSSSKTKKKSSGTTTTTSTSTTNNNIMKAFSTRGGATKQLIETVLSVLRRDGHVLLPVDASGRVLELVLFLSQHWDRQRLGAAYNLVWLGPMVKNTLDFARSQLEWMASQLGNQFDDSNNTSSNNKNAAQQKQQQSFMSASHPYSLRNVHLCSSIQELDAVIRQNNNNPTCVLASGLSLDHGPARELFLRWADNADHAIVFTDSSRCFQRRALLTMTNNNQNNKMAGSGEDVVMEEVTSQSQQQQQLQPKMDKTQQQHQVKLEDQPILLRQTSTGPTAVGGAAVIGGAAAAADAEHDEDDDNENTMMVGSALGPEEKVSKFCAAAQLLQQWCNAKWEGREMDDSILVDVEVPFRSPLAGPELKSFLAHEEAKRQYQKQEEEKRAMLREVEIAKGQLRLGEDEAGTTTSSTVVGVDTSKSAAGAASTSSGGTMVKSRPKKKSRFDSSLFLKFSKPLHLTFEVREEAVGVGQDPLVAKYGIGEIRSGEVLEDDYGIAVKPERFTDIVSGVDPQKFAGGTGRIGEETMRRGFGFGAGGGPGGKAAGNANDDDVGELEDEMDEQAMEAADLSEGNGIIRGRNGRTPTKVTTVPRRLEVLAEIAYVPLEGRVDARAARQSVRALQPRQVIVLGGPAPRHREPPSKELPLEVVDEVSILAEAAESFVMDRKSQINTPSDGETAELSVGHAAYSVRLIDTHYLTREQKQYNLEHGLDPPEPMEPYETKAGACTVSLLDSVATGQKVALDGSIVLAPRPLSKASARRYPSVYISEGEVLLTDLRSELIAQGMKAEYSAQAGYSQLVVNGKVIVKKGQDSRRLDVEGPLCEDFYAVRGVICGQYVTL